MKRERTPFEYLSHEVRIKKDNRMVVFFYSYSVREKIRTPDTLVRSQVLYPAELHTRIRIFFVPCYFTRIVTISQELFLFFYWSKINIDFIVVARNGA